MHIDYLSPLDPAFAASVGPEALKDKFSRAERPNNESAVRVPNANAIRTEIKAAATGFRPHTKRPSKRIRISADTSCSDRSYKIYHRDFLGTRTSSYKTKLSSYPAGSTTSNSIRQGAYAWNNTVNSCGNGDQNNITLSRTGDTNATAGSARDGQNTVDFGSTANVGCGALPTVACVIPRGNSEFDMRFNTQVTWSHSGASGAMDVQSIAAHEMGHYLGMDHASTSSNFLTMYPYALSGAIRQRDLGIGDIVGMRAAYPPY